MSVVWLIKTECTTYIQEDLVIMRVTVVGYHFTNKGGIYSIVYQHTPYVNQHCTYLNRLARLLFTQSLQRILCRPLTLFKI